MKKMTTVVLFCLAALGLRPAGFSTANAGPTKEDLEKELAELRERAAFQQAEIDKLRDAANGPARVPAEASSALQLMCVGAGVALEDVTWRIRAGLTESQAVEVALREKLEAEVAA